MSADESAEGPHHHDRQREALATGLDHQMES
jgi:hypothetical protein